MNEYYSLERKKLIIIIQRPYASLFFFFFFFGFRGSSYSAGLEFLFFSFFPPLKTLAARVVWFQNDDSADSRRSTRYHAKSVVTFVVCFAFFSDYDDVVDY